MSPRAMHHVGWMLKCIYSLKIWMFKSQCKVISEEEKILIDVLNFIPRVYLKAWVSAPEASYVSYNDLLLMKSLIKYSTIQTSQNQQQIF